MKRIAAVLLCTTLLASAAEPRPGWIGIGFTYHLDARTKEGWVHVQHVVGGGPAAAAGVRAHDVIVRIDGRKLRFADDLAAVEFFAALRPRQRLALTIVRAGEQKRIEVTAVELPAARYERWRANRERAREKARHR